MKKVNISIPEELLQRLDQAVAQGYLNRSQVLCHLVEQWLGPDRALIPVDNSGPEDGQPPSSHLPATQQPPASHPAAICQPPSSHLPEVQRACARVRGSDREIDRSIDRSVDAQKNSAPPSPAPRPPKGRETKSMLPAEVAVLREEYLHEAPDTLQDVFDVIAKAQKRKELPLDHQKALLLEWRERPMKRRLWAFRKLLKQRDQVPHPEEYLATLMENGPRKQNRVNRNQTTFFGRGPPAPGQDLVTTLAGAKRLGGGS